MKVRIGRRWKRVIRRRKRFYVSYKRIARRVTFRKTTFRILIKRRWKTLP
jgi:hypothetical protein